jgi:hypothetical protein
MKYRILRGNDKPDKAKGDQVKIFRVWYHTVYTGTLTLAQMRSAGVTAIFRRPVRRRARKTVAP